MALLDSLIKSFSLLIALSLLYTIVLTVYRLYFHPLAKFPGPKLAAATYWYETYYDVYPHIGQFAPRIKRMHDEYGPIVRVGPNSININDIDYMDTIYPAANRRRNRRESFRWATASPNSVLGTTGHDLHGKRRAALSPFFSKSSIRSLEEVIKAKLEKLCDRLKNKIDPADGHDAVVKTSTAFTALTTDVITEYAYGKSWGYLDKEDFDQRWKDGMRNAWISILQFQNFWWFGWLASITPPWLALKLDPNLDGFMQLMQNVSEEVRKTLREEKKAARKTVFRELRDSNLPAEERTHQRLVEDGMLVVGAGTEATARALYLITFYLLDRPELLQKLRAELNTLDPQVKQSPSLADLEKLPYLQAIIWEAMRVHGSSAMPNHRVAPDETLHYGEWAIPPGTEIGVINCFFGFDEKLFPDPLSFKPERWLTADAKMKSNITKISFGTGSRTCLGRNLAVAEIFFVTAALFSRFDMELVDTTEDDVVIKHYSLGPVPGFDSNGVQVRIKGMLET